MCRMLITVIKNLIYYYSCTIFFCFNYYTSFIILFYFRSINAITNIKCPTYERIVDHLIFNQTLPQPCQTFINFSSFNNDDYVLKSAAYNHSNNSGPFLISSTGIYYGKRIEYNNIYIDQFLGVYYAESPLPLQKPVKKKFSYTIQNATTFGPCCMQSLLMTENLSYGSFVMKRNFDNNCLSLNIYRSDLRFGERKKAITIFSHGGSNQIGAGSLFDGSILAGEGDIIVVTMNFRLNYHGFLSSGDTRIKGNYGLWDQLLAIQWVSENAHLFGGDNTRIVLAGHSAGAGNVMLLPASPYCRGMIKRVLSQSGTGLAPWSINHRPMKLVQRFSKEFGCDHLEENRMLDCVYKLLEQKIDFYRLHLSLNIADDNPYPVIDNDFLNDTLENTLQSNAYQNIDIMTGVTLNEGLYFAEYHIAHFYSSHFSSNMKQRENVVNNNNSNNQNKFREKRLVRKEDDIILPPDIVPISAINEDEVRSLPLNDDGHPKSLEEKQKNTPDSNVYFQLDAYGVLKQFSKVNYIERYINANFLNGHCHLDNVRKRYETPGKNNITIRSRLYIDLVSDLMFNYHMVQLLNIRAKTPNVNSSTYAYIYSHKPTFKAKSLFRDHLKTLPTVVGHFAELDYVFGVPLAKDYPKIHNNVNKNWYNYSVEEQEFSRQIIRYWTNFIKTGDPNDGLPVPVQWNAYTNVNRAYIDLKLNDIQRRQNYFDSMYDFWFELYKQDKIGCSMMKTKKKNIFIILALILLIITFMLGFLIIRRHIQRKSIYRRSINSPSTIPISSHNNGVLTLNDDHTTQPLVTSFHVKT